MHDCLWKHHLVQLASRGVPSPHQLWATCSLSARRWSLVRFLFWSFMPRKWKWTSASCTCVETGPLRLCLWLLGLMVSASHMIHLRMHWVASPTMDPLRHAVLPYGSVPLNCSIYPGSGVFMGTVLSRKLVTMDASLFKLYTLIWIAHKASGGVISSLSPGCSPLTFVWFCMLDMSGPSVLVLSSSPEWTLGILHTARSSIDKLSSNMKAPITHRETLGEYYA